MSANNWTQLRQQARQLESKTEQQFHTYSHYASLPSLPREPSDDEQATHSQLTSLLSERDTVISSLSRSLDSDPAPSALKSSHLARHRELLTQHKSSLRTLDQQISQARSRSNLLASVRDDIETYRAGQDPAAEEAEYMLGERQRIENSHGVADNVLAQAYAVNESFGLQRENLERVRQRITGAAAMVPGMNELMNRIAARRRRDGYLLGGFMAACFLVFWFFS